MAQERRQRGKAHLAPEMEEDEQRTSTPGPDLTISRSLHSFFLKS